VSGTELDASAQKASTESEATRTQVRADDASRATVRSHSPAASAAVVGPSPKRSIANISSSGIAALSFRASHEVFSEANASIAALCHASTSSVAMGEVFKPPDRRKPPELHSRQTHLH
jgi:hypothetical protein